MTNFLDQGSRILGISLLVGSLVACDGGRDELALNAESRASESAELDTLLEAESSASGCIAPSVQDFVDSQQILAQLLATAPAGMDPQPQWDISAGILKNSLSAFLTGLQQNLLAATTGAPCATSRSTDGSASYRMDSPFAGTPLASLGDAMDAVMLDAQNMSGESAGNDFVARASALTQSLALLTQALADLLYATQLNFVVADVLNLVQPVVSSVYPLLGDLMAMDPASFANNLANLVVNLLSILRPSGS